jgi:ribonucleoside-diphosphate reductase beta chain
MFLRLLSVFQAGEEAVTLDLLPLILAVSREGRIEEEIYLTTFLFEEAKHTDFFQRYLSEVCQNPADLSRYHTPSYKALFYEELPSALHRLLEDPSPENQALAAVTYNMIVEGVLAETGYYVFLDVLKRNEIELPGLIEGITHIKRDESRHIAYGIYLISRIVAEYPHLWEKVEERLNTLMGLAQGFVSESFRAYTEIPYRVTEEELISYAFGQFEKRYERLKKARGKGAREVEEIAMELGEAA